MPDACPEEQHRQADARIGANPFAGHGKTHEQAAQAQIRQYSFQRLQHNLPLHKAQHEEEKTIFDFKIRRPVEKKSARPKEAVKDDSSVNSVPKPAAETDNAKTEK